MQKNKFDLNARLSLEYAGDYAYELISPNVDIAHFLLGVLKNANTQASAVLVENGITTIKVLTYVKFAMKNEQRFAKKLNLSTEMKNVIEKSYEISNSKEISVEHLLVAILKSEDDKTKLLIKALKIDANELVEKLNFGVFKQKVVFDKKRQLDSRVLNQYGKELVMLAINGELDPVVGRDKEIMDMICVLSRRRKNNPIILGEAGVGKTALVEGLAHKIATESVPHALKNKKIVSLDLSAIIAGTKYRGEFEDRVKNIADECIKHKDVILFIDEVHIIMGAGGAEGAIDAANILKPALSRGQIQIIGATTFEEYRKNIEKDTALERRFQKINLDEPSIEETKIIIGGIKNHFEKYHRVKISENAINTAISLSSRYITDKRLPDKAIDLIDEACAKYNLQQKLSGTKMEASTMIDSTDIEQIIARYTGIDSFKLDDNAKNVIERLTKNIEETIIGQKEASEKIINAIKRAKVGINDPNRPLGSFIFLGPTGVGKTEICKSIAKGLFGTEKSIIRLDMSEYMDKSSVTKIIGASAGFVGYDDSVAITEKIRRNPYSLILFDEIEKAHPDILNLLLQVLEDGIITDSKHRKINFKNAIIIMTSNIGATKLTNQSLGFDREVDTKIDAIKELKKVFKPELINRIDEVVVFNKLNIEDIQQITAKMLEKLENRVESIGLEIEFSADLVKHLSEKGYNKIYGARPIRRLITECIENELTDKIIAGNFVKGDKISINFDKSITFTKKTGVILDV